MNKKSFTVDYILLAVFAVCIAGSLVAVLYFKAEPTIPLIISGIAIAAIIAILVAKNYRHSAYGGQFKNRYPDHKS